jgi:monofunctional glycosyltransferase
MSRFRKQWLKWLAIVLALNLALIAPLRLFAPLTSAFMLRQHLQDLMQHGRWQSIEQHWVGHERISKFAYAAVLAAEDQRFFQHTGVEWRAVLQAYQHNQSSKRLRGASTISQQVAKNLFLSPARSYVRKIMELWLTGWLELLWPKQRILDMYLNLAEFGDHVFGVEAASHRYFGVSAAQLSAPQAALLAATLPNPQLLKADRPSAYVLRRQRWILAQMRQFL